MNHSFSHMFEVKKFYNIKATPEGVAEGAEKPQSPAEQLKQAQDHQRNLVQVTKALKDQGVDWNDPQYQQAKETYMKSLDRSQEIVSAAKNDAVEAHNKFNDAVQKAPNATEVEKKEAISARNGEIAGLEMDALKAKKDAKETSLNNQQAVQATVEDKYGDSEEGDEYPTSGTLTPEQAAKEVRAEADALRDKILKENVAKAQGNPTEAGAEGGATATAAATEKAPDTQSQEKNVTNSQIEKTKEYEKKVGIKLEWNPDGTLSEKSLRKLIADLDQDRVVEKQNTGFFDKYILRRGNQKFIAGEGEVSHLLEDMSSADIDAMYKRLTGNSDSIILTKDDRDLVDFARGKNSSPDVRLSDNYLNARARQKIKNLQTIMLERSGSLATIMSIIIKDGKSQIPGIKSDYEARAGLASVINGTEYKLLAALNDPKNVQKFAEIVQNSPELQEDQNLIGKLFGALSRFGLGMAANVFSGGALSAKYQSKELEAGSTSRGQIDLKSGEANLRLGEKGKVGIDLNILSADAVLNWNDPEMLITSVRAAFEKTPDKTQATENLIQKATESTKGLKPEKQAHIKTLSDEFRRNTQQLIAQRDKIAQTNPEDPRVDAFNKAIDQNVMIYMAKVIQEKGLKLQGIYASFGLTSLTFGLSAAKINTYGSVKNVSEGGAKIESEINLKEVSLEEVHKKLAKFGIERREDGYYDGDKLLIAVGQNQEVGWDIRDLAYIEKATLKATIKIREKGSGEIKEFTFQINNPEHKNAVVQSNSKAIVDVMGILKGAKNSRSQSAEIRQFQNTANRIENGENDAATIDSALGHAKTMFKGTAAEKLFDEALAEAGTDLNKRRALADILLRKTSGGDKSHEIAKSFREGAGYDATRQKVIDYYSPRSKSNPEGRNIADVFANSYASVGLDRASIMNLLNAMLPAGADVKTSTLGSHAPHGFMAMEAYHQGKGAFKRLDTVHHHNAEVFGQPAEVTNKAQADKIRAELASRLPADQVRDEMQRYIAQKPEEANNPNLEQQVRQMLVAGPVYSYLSFEQDAECFNLGFFVKPGNNKWQKPSEPLTNFVGTGAVVGREVAIKTELGLGFGMKKTPKDEPPTTTPGEGTAATIAGAKGREIGEVAGNLTKSTADAVAKNVTSGNLMDDILKGF